MKKFLKTFPYGMFACAILLPICLIAALAYGVDWSGTDADTWSDEREFADECLVRSQQTSLDDFFGEYPSCEQALLTQGRWVMGMHTPPRRKDEDDPPIDCTPRFYKATDDFGDGLETDCGWPGMPDCLYIPLGCP